MKLNTNITLTDIDLWGITSCEKTLTARKISPGHSSSGPRFARQPTDEIAIFRFKTKMTVMLALTERMEFCLGFDSIMQCRLSKHPKSSLDDDDTEWTLPELSSLFSASLAFENVNCVVVHQWPNRRQTDRRLRWMSAKNRQSQSGSFIKRGHCAIS
jgi:hypothetical protein